MKNVNYWKTHPREMRRMIDDMIQEINDMPNKVLLNTFFVTDMDKFLSHKDSKAVIISFISDLYSESMGHAIPPQIKKHIRRSISDDKEVYIRIEDILRLEIISRDQLQVYKNIGLIDFEVFPKHNIGYAWKVIKQIAR